MLTRTDLENFARLGIPEELLREAGVRRVSDRVARLYYRIKALASRDMTGIIFPYLHPKTGNRCTARLRRDHPEIEDGKPKYKYMSPYGDWRHLYFPPGCVELLKQPAVPVVLVEAEKSALAITAWSRRTGIRVAPVAMGGCWGWRGRIGTEEDEKGQIVEKRGPLNDLHYCDAHNVIVLLDANVSTNKQVQSAQAALVAELRKRKCKVKTPNLPTLEGVNGPDDFIGICGDEALKEILSRTQFSLPNESALTLSPEEVIAEIEQLFRLFVVLPEAAYLIVALWIIATHCADLFDVFPYFNLRSPVKRCGKTRVLELVQPLVSNGWMVVYPSVAAVFRMMDAGRTLLLDEVETLTAGSGKGGLSETQQALTAIFNAGYKKGAMVPRCDGPHHEVNYYPVYGPKAFGSTKPVPDTLADRSICISMQRRLPSQKIKRYLSSKVASAAQGLASAISQSVAVNRGAIEQMYFVTEDLSYVSDRDAEIFLPLFAVCSTFAPDRLGEFENAARILTGAKAESDTDSSATIQLLADIRTVLRPDEKAISTRHLTDRLCALAGSPWSEYKLTQRTLAMKLRPFDLVSRTVRPQANKFAKGYKREDLETVFDRYLPQMADTSVTSVTTRMDKGDEGIF